MKTTFTVLALIASSIFVLASESQANYRRFDGIVFDSDVGAACGALSTDILFQPWESEIDIQDEPVLDYLANCLKYGALEDARITVTGMADESSFPGTSSELATDRMNAVIGALIERGVDARQLEPMAFTVSWGFGDFQPNRVAFRIVEGHPSWMAQ